MAKIKRRPNPDNKRPKGSRSPTQRLDGTPRAGKKKRDDG